MNDSNPNNMKYSQTQEKRDTKLIDNQCDKTELLSINNTNDNNNKI